MDPIIDDFNRYRQGMNERILETFGIAIRLGGSIVIPPLRRAVEFWDAIGSVQTVGE
jgi:hypothetical protein